MSINIKVVNKYKHTHTNRDIYIGRGSVLGNPYTSIKDRKTKAEFICNSRDESVDKYAVYLKKKIEDMDAVICTELNRIYDKAKTGTVYLVCFCKPKLCHGDVIRTILEKRYKADA